MHSKAGPDSEQPCIRFPMQGAMGECVGSVVKGMLKAENQE